MNRTSIVPTTPMDEEIEVATSDEGTIYAKEVGMATEIGTKIKRTDIETKTGTKETTTGKTGAVMKTAETIASDTTTEGTGIGTTTGATSIDGKIGGAEIGTTIEETEGKLEMVITI